LGVLSDGKIIVGYKSRLERIEARV